MRSPGVFIAISPMCLVLVNFHLRRFLVTTILHMSLLSDSYSEPFSDRSYLSF